MKKNLRPIKYNPLHSKNFTYEDLKKNGVNFLMPEGKPETKTTFSYGTNFGGAMTSQECKLSNFPSSTGSQFLWASRIAEDYFPASITAVNFSKPGSVIFHVKTKDLYMLASFFKRSCFFNCDLLMDIVTVDTPSRSNRFELTYALLSSKYGKRLYLRIHVSERDVVPSLTDLFSSANWLEREVWDMFGVPFDGHPDLRRILTDYGFFGHPMRKDFPLTGYFEVRYDDTTRRIVSESLTLTQEMRLFSFIMPWRPL